MALPQTMTLAERATTALDEAFGDSIKQHFLILVGQVAGDDRKDLKGDLDHFRKGLSELKTLHEGALAIADEIFGVLS